jgi:broad specificity phosphatase PhoE
LCGSRGRPGACGSGSDTTPKKYRYASGLIRTQETAAPLASVLNMPVQALSGLNEISAGILEGAQQNDLTGLLYLAAPFAWTLGLYFVPELGSSDYNGMAFEDYFGDAVQTIYDNTTSGGVGDTDIAFSSDAAIMTWTLMNVNNPDPLLMLEDPPHQHQPARERGVQHGCIGVGGV